jgi:hypothetical protein
MNVQFQNQTKNLQSLTTAFFSTALLCIVCLFLLFQKSANASGYACSFEECLQYYGQGVSQWSSWPTQLPAQAVGIGGYGMGAGTIGMSSIFGGLFQSEEFLECQSNWSSYSDDCQEAVTTRRTQVTGVCEYVAYAAGASGSRALGAVALGCVLGAAAGEDLGHKQCSDDAVNGILENCLG